MYAEERQQAIAALVGAGRSAVGGRARRRSSASPPRPSAATSPPWSGPVSSAASTAASCPPDALSVLETGGHRPRPRERRGEGPHRHRRRWSWCPRAAASSSTPARPRPGWPALLPLDRRLEVLTHAVPIAARLAGHPAIGLRLLPGPGARDHPGRRRRGHRRGARAGCGPTSRSSAPTASRAAHGLSTPDHDEAAVKRAIVAGARQVVLLADADKLGQEHLVRFADLGDVDVLVTDAAGHRRRARPARGRRRQGRGRMIVTLTANPSFDRTIALAGRLERGGVLRADAVLEQAGGKGVNISRAAAAAGRADTVAVFPAEADSAFTARAASTHGIACRPVAPTGPVRVNLTLTEPDGTTTKINSAGAAADAALLDRLRERRRPGSPPTHAGSCSPVRCLPAHPRTAGTPRWPPPSPAPSARGRRGHLRRAAGSPSRSGSSTARPDVLKPNAEELALLTGDDAGRHRGRPGGRRPGSRPARRPPAPAPCWRPWEARARCSSPPRAPGTRRAPPITVVSTVGRRRLQPLRLPPRRPPRRGARRPAPPRRRLRQRRRRAARHHHPRPPPGPSGPRRPSARSTTPRPAPRPVPAAPTP